MAALAAALRYRLQNGGSIVRGGKANDYDDDNHVVGTYEFFAVVKNPTLENPLGDDHQVFRFNYKKTLADGTA